jgi:hypothetical protein
MGGCQHRSKVWKSKTASLMPSPPPFGGFVEYVKRLSTDPFIVSVAAAVCSIFC